MIGISLGLFCLGFAQLLNLTFMSFSKFGKTSDILRVWPYFSSASGALITWMLDFFLLSHRSWGSVYFFSNVFSLCGSNWVISIVCPQDHGFSLFHPVAELSRELFWFVNLNFKFSIWFFFISSIYLLKLSNLFFVSSLIIDCWTIFMMATLKSYSKHLFEIIPSSILSWYKRQLFIILSFRLWHFLVLGMMSDLFEIVSWTLLDYIMKLWISWKSFVLAGFL